MNLYKTLLLTLIICTACTQHRGNEMLVHDTQTSTKDPEKTLVLTQVAIPNAPDGSVSERGIITVPVNRNTESGQTIDIEFFRFKRLPEADPDTPPIFLLRGGPGYPGLGNAVNNEAFYKGGIQRYTLLSDLIIVGQRGFGSSGDLSCSDVAPSAFEEVNTSAKSQARYRHTAKLCRDKYLAEGIDLSGYNVKEMAADVADIASGLGYERIQIKGNSFGSFWGMAVIRHHTNLVERATFSALEGPDHTFDRPAPVKAALSAVAKGAEDSERYADRIPPEGLIAAYEAVIERATKAPIPTSFVDEKSGETMTINVDGNALRRFIFGVTTQPVYRYTMHDWPADLLKIIEGDLSEMAPLLYQYMRGTDADNAAREIIECSSGISAERRADIGQDSALKLISPSVLLDERNCALWGDAVVEMDRSDFKSSVPTVLVQGTWDISTPYDDAKSVRTLFTNHHFVTVEGGSHGSIFEAEEADPSFAAALDRWYATGEVEAIPNQVLLPDLSWNGDE